jgi:hypothetical protein
VNPLSAELVLAQCEISLRYFWIDGTTLNLFLSGGWDSISSGRWDSTLFATFQSVLEDEEEEMNY